MYSNSTLIELLKEGDETAFREIYDRYYDPVLKNISKWEADLNSREDILQEVFMELWNKKEHISPNVNIGGWLFTTSYHMTMSHLRKTLKMPIRSIENYSIEQLHRMPDEEDILLKEALYVSKLGRLKSAIELLSEQKKKAFILYKVKGLPYVEIARQMGISEFSVRQYVKMAMNHLRKLVKISDKELSILCIIVFCLSR
ncbi:hypothetical protein A8C56_12180 [Niabella ginsenosidivorans]|uniref:RNA polymerase subunit sigma-24 n=1 Tax=Niabella ginsenosidivorans TaxID=1176587 RepID=A0A1A9I1V5_9BACT|nr:sigma-70 family RNA polymerase sigma factor [Niabella ginsenosidivorans]ANH81634.1 hypothetical protein A8C56_12165 [Niabella ginsenosidivorans]ANH81637.1 hypothetical protein A8C56_12180 [Niabella ginsenosidivorans]